MKRLTAERLALTGALTAVFDGVHPFSDWWLQRDRDAALKGLHGDHKVYADGVIVGEETGDRTGQRTCTASQAGRRAAASHAASYTACQVAATVAVTRAMGYRVPVRALLAGAAVNGVTHAVIDRRAFLLWLAGKAGKRAYIDHCAAVRMNAGGELTAEAAGPGTALLEYDQVLHRVIGVLAAAVTAWLATRGGAE